MRGVPIVNSLLAVADMDVDKVGGRASADQEADQNGMIPADIQFSKYKGGTIRRKKKVEDCTSPPVPALESNCDQPAQTLQQLAQSGFSVGFAEDRNSRHRRTMEDAHSYVYDFGNVKGQGWFAIYDGHAGKAAADWCGEYTHTNFWKLFQSYYKGPSCYMPSPQVNMRDYIDGDGPKGTEGGHAPAGPPSGVPSVPDVLNETFQHTDKQLLENQIHAGCTAVVGFIRVEDRLTEELQQIFSREQIEALPLGERTPSAKAGAVNATLLRHAESADSFVTVHGSTRDLSSSPLPKASACEDLQETRRVRVLYCANVGDARLVLCRAGKAIRLSYDHKGSDNAESMRIFERGGFVMNQRVNGVLAVTRSLGDHAMKEHVLGHPYTTEIVLSNEDEFLILACDGVWDVCTDEQACEEVRQRIDTPQLAAEHLLQYSLDHQSMDNLSVMVVKLESSYTAESPPNS